MSENVIKLEQDTEVTLTLNAVDVQQIVNTLGQLPMAQVEELVNKIRQQVQAGLPVEDE